MSNKSTILEYDLSKQKKFLDKYEYEICKKPVHDDGQNRIIMMNHFVKQYDGHFEEVSDDMFRDAMSHAEYSMPDGLQRYIHSISLVDDVREFLPNQDNPDNIIFEQFFKPYVGCSRLYVRIGTKYVKSLPPVEEPPVIDSIIEEVEDGKPETQEA